MSESTSPAARRRTAARVVAAGALAAVVLAAGACSGGSGDKGTETGNVTLTFGLTAPAMNFLPLYVAQSEGLFAKRGLTVNESQVDGSAVAIRAAAAGDVDVFGLLPEGALTGIARGAKIKIIGATNNKIAYQVYVRPGIKTVDDLAGKKIAILTQGNGTDILMRWLLDEKGSGADKSQFIAAGGMRERLAALTNSQADATLLAPPFISAAQAAGMVQLGDLRTLIPAYNGPDVVAASDRVLTAKPEAVKGFMAALAEAVGWIEQNPDAAIEIGKKRLGIDDAAAKEAFEFLRPTFPADAAADPAGIQFSIDVLRKYGGLEEPLSVDQVYTDKFLPSA